MRQLDDKLYRLRDAFNRLGAFAAITDDLHFEGVSSTFTALLGYEEEDLRGKNINSITFVGGDSLQLRQMTRHLYSGGTWIGDVVCRHQNGTAVELRMSVAPSISGGVITGFLAQYQRSLIPHSPFGLNDVLYRYRAGFTKIAAMAIVTSTGEIHEVNDMFAEVFGYERDQIIGRHVGKVTRQEHLTEVPPHIWAVLSRGQVYTGEIDAYRQDGERLRVRMTIAPANEASMEVLASFDAFLVIYQDITQETIMREAQQDMAVEQARQQMLDGAIHNISNLQQGVLAANARTLAGAQGLQDACKAAAQHYQTLTSPDERHKFLDGMAAIVAGAVKAVMTAAREEREAIDETVSVLNSFRREQKNIRLVVDESVQAFVQRILNTFSLQAARHNIAIAIRSMVDVEVKWPTSQVHQIILNLLINAQQAICEQVEQGHLAAHRGRIELSIEEDGDDIVFYVRDNAGGFHVPVHTLFRPHYTTKKNGSGIGLHTSAIMAQAMGGNLSADNGTSLGARGAVFTLRLPRFIAPKGGD